MSKLLITIGGTGSRGGNASIFALAANMADGLGDLLVMCMDKDTQNGTTANFYSAMDTYDELAKVLGKADQRAFARFDIDPGRKGWTMEGILGKDGGDTLESYCTPESRKFLELFYTEKERKMSLRNGFERHPNIGSLVFEGIKVNPNFSAKIEEVLKEGHSEIFIIGSIFGGTGASMFVNIAQYIREQAMKFGEERSKSVLIGGALLLPYFNIPQVPQEEKKNEPLTDDDITEATQTALGYYGNIPNLVRGGEPGCEAGHAIFDALYVAGLHPRCRITHERSKAVYAKGGSNQTSECNVVDLLVASALCHFYKAAANPSNRELEIKHGETNQNLYVATLTADDKSDFLQIGWDNLPANTEQLKTMLYFALSVCGIFYPDYQIAKKKKNAIYCRYLKNGKKHKPGALIPLQKFCATYLDFVFQIASTYADNAPICDLVNRDKLEELLAFIESQNYTAAVAKSWNENLSGVLGSQLSFSFSELLQTLNGKFNFTKAETELDLINAIYRSCQTI